MPYGAKLEWWDTPLSAMGYERFSVTRGSWENDRFLVPINCFGAHTAQETWLCSIANAIWVRVIGDEFYEPTPALPEGAFRGPFYHLVGSEDSAASEKWLRDTGRLRDDQLLREYLIASMDNQLHFLTVDEPTFERLGPSSGQAPRTVN
jgi:hypothetical protein